jgi:hypothetical protein
VVLQRDVYAMVSLGGAILVTIFRAIGLSGAFPLPIAALLMTGIRLLALYRRWSARSLCRSGPGSPPAAMLVRRPGVEGRIMGNLEPA